MNNLRGKRFGRLMVISDIGRTNDRHVLWLCRCDCGKCVNVSSRDLISGHTKSCGCLQKDVVREKRYKHGDRDERLYSVWKSMKKRCENPNCKSYKLSGE